VHQEKARSPEREEMVLVRTGATFLTIASSVGLPRTTNRSDFFA
jgi:hypothetical protein